MLWNSNSSSVETLFHTGGGLKTAPPCEKLKYFFGHNRL